MKNKEFLIILIIILSVCLFSCNNKQIRGGSYDFVIYESDDDNNDLSDNLIICKYTIEYKNCSFVSETLIKDGNKYYFTKDSKDYLVLENTLYGFTYKYCYFENYSLCSDNKEIECSYSMTLVNGKSAENGISKTKLDGLKEYSFVINGWK